MASPFRYCPVIRKCSQKERSKLEMQCRFRPSLFGKISFSTSLNKYEHKSLLIVDTHIFP